MFVYFVSKGSLRNLQGVVLLLVFIKQQYDGHKSSKVHLLRKIKSDHGNVSLKRFTLILKTVYSLLYKLL